MQHVGYIVGDLLSLSSYMQLLHLLSHAKGFYSAPANTMPSRGHTGCNQHSGFTRGGGNHIPSCRQSTARQLL